MPAARYWRLTFDSSRGGAYLQIRELAFLDAAGVDQSTGGAAYASSTYSYSWAPAYAFDKSAATAWCNASSQFPASIWYHHPSAVDVAGVRLHFDPDIGYAPPAAANMHVAWSHDGVAWQADSRVLQITEGSIAANAICTMVLAEPAPLRTIHSCALVAASAPVPPHSTLSAPRLLTARNVEFAGSGTASATGTIYGSTAIKGSPNAPVRAKVSLLRARDLLLVQQTWSDPATGTYAFHGLDPFEKYTTLAEYPTGDYRAVAADQLTPDIEDARAS